jgi:hypothetical protein
MNPKYETSVFGRDIAITVPTTSAEFDRLAKKEGATLEFAIDHEIAHGTLGTFRKAVIEAIVKQTGIARRAIGTGTFIEKDGKKTEVTKPEQDQKCFDRICAEKNVDPKTAFQDVFDSLSAGGSAEVKFDPSITPREPGKPPVLSKDYITSAAFNLGKLDDAKINKVLSKDLPAEQCTFKRTGDAEKDAVTLGWLLRARESAIRKKPIVLQ